MKFSLVIAEAAIEKIPEILYDNKIVKDHALRLNKPVNELILDINYHYFAMKKARLEHREKRGRPDIIHLCLLSILSTPLFFENNIKVYVHTIDNKVIFIGENLRIPKSFLRFEGVMIKLFLEKKIISNHKTSLLEIKDMTLEQLLRIIKPDEIIGFSTTGTTGRLEQILAKNLINIKGHYAFIVGGFQSGHFSEQSLKNMAKIFSISRYSLEAHVVISRLTYECEKFLINQNPN
jgi:rRNA small subunit pseudouridine methyltransferase Nep1